MGGKLPGGSGCKVHPLLRLISNNRSGCPPLHSEPAQIACGGGGRVSQAQRAKRLTGRGPIPGSRMGER